MAYPGNPELSGEAQERVIAAFRQAINKLQQGQRQEATLGLEFVLRMDPAFAPAASLHEQLASGAAEIDLTAVISQLQAPTTDAVNELLVEAVDAFNNRDFVDARDKVKKVLLDLPGHREARDLLKQIEDALKIETQVGQFLTRAREAIDGGDLQEAANFVMMAQALDPHAHGIDSMLAEINAVGQAGAAAPPAEEPASFETMAFNTADVDVSAEGAPAPAEVSFEPMVDEPAAEATFEPEPVSFEPEPEPIAFETDPGFGGDGGGDDGGDFSFEPLPDDSADDGGGEVSFGFDDAAAPAEADGEVAFDEPPALAAEPPAAEAEADFAFEAPPPLAEDDDFAFGTDSALDSAPSGSLFDDDSGDVADLFDASGAGAGFDPSAASSLTAEADLLVQQGQEAFDRGEFSAAIEAWSKIYAIDPNSDVASELIDRARARMAETEQQVGMMLADASDAEASGDTAKALELVNAILELNPDQPEAVDIKRRLDPSAAIGGIPDLADITPPDPGVGIPSLDDVEEDLFDDVPSATDGALDELPDISLDIPETTKKKKARKGPGGLPLSLIGIIAAAVVVIGLGAFLGHKFLSGSSEDAQAEALNQVLEQAEVLFQQRQIEEAIHLLQEFEASELDRERLERRIASYQEALAPPTPTPIPKFLTEAETLIEQGLWMAAYEKSIAGLEAHPQDLGLADLRDRLLDLDPDLKPLHNSLKNRDFETAAQLARDLDERHPDSPEFKDVYARCLFNSALAELRSYNLSGALNDLNQLLTVVPDDEEAKRVQEFVSRYRSRPVDMQLEIFVAALKER